MPLRTVTLSSSGFSVLADGATTGACAGIGCGAAGRAVVRATGCAPTTGIGAVIGCASGASAVGLAASEDCSVARVPVPGSARRLPGERPAVRRSRRCRGCGAARRGAVVAADGLAVVSTGW